MRYSTFGNTGLTVSALGFGCMRLPMKNGKVDREQSTPLLRSAFQKGVTFFDTAIGYCESDSQPAVGEALEPIRDQVVISTKNHLHTAAPDEWRRQLENSLRLLRTDHVDIYNHHGISWQTFTEHLDPDKGGLTREMLRARDEGLVRHVGFSFHAPPDDLKKLADTGIFESVILQYNLLDQANAEAMHYVHEQGMGIVVMGPIGGGRLGLPSERIGELTGGAARSTPEAALRFVWAHPAVNVALSGMENERMLEENVAIAEHTEPFTPAQTDALNRLVDERKRKSGLYCSGCRYCVPACAAGVSIPEQLDLLNMAKIYGLRDAAASRYQSRWTVKVKASECVNCGRCLEKCPQKIDIPARMREVVTLLDPRAGSVELAPQMRAMDATGAFVLRVKARSLSDTDTPLTVTVDSEAPVSLSEHTLDFGCLPAFGRASREVAGTASPASPTIALHLQPACADQSERIDVAYGFVLLPTGLDDSWEGGRWHEISAPPRAFSSDAETAPLHGARFKLGVDDTGVRLFVDVRDDFLCPSRAAEHRGALVDSVELFLDVREPGRVGLSAYEDGVHQITLYPGTPGSEPPFAHARGDVEPALWAERTDTGYRLRCDIAWSALKARGGLPEKFGFDLAVNTANARGERIAQYTWAGGADNWCDASKFRDVWPVALGEERSV